jgi:hypothetical protein
VASNSGKIVFKIVLGNGIAVHKGHNHRLPKEGGILACEACLAMARNDGDIFSTWRLAAPECGAIGE